MKKSQLREIIRKEILLEKSFYRVNKRAIDKIERAYNDLKYVLRSLKNNKDFDIKQFELILKELNDVHDNAKLFSSPDEVSDEYKIK